MLSLSRTLFRAAVAVAFAVGGGAFSFSSYAQVPWMGIPESITSSDRAFELQPWAGGMVSALPSFGLPSQRQMAVWRQKIMPKVAESIFGVSGHFDLSRYRMPVLLGRDPRLTVSFGRSQGRSKYFNPFRSQSTFPFIGATVDGRVGIITTGGGVESRIRHLYVQRENYAVSAKLTSKVSLSNSIVMAPTIGVIGEYTSDLYQYRSVSTISPSAANFDLKNRSFRMGAHMGFLLRHEWRPGVRFILAGGVDLYWVRASMRASDCVVQTSGCSIPVGTLISNGVYRTTASDNRSAFGLRTTASLGLTWRLRWLTAHIGGFFSWDSAAPGIENPVPKFGAAFGTFVGASRIKFSSAWSTGGFLVVKIPL